MITEMQKFAAISKYASHLPSKGRREVWSETVDRYCGMMDTIYGRMTDDVRDAIRSMEVVPSMRALQFGGRGVMRKNARAYNCTASYVDRLDFFGKAFWLLLCGCGVGYSLQERHMKYLPQLRRPTGKPIVFTVPDTIEGWADCAHVMMSAFHEWPVRGFERFHGRNVVFNYGKIRAKGTPIADGVGVSPGYEPLANANERVWSLLSKASVSDERMSSIQAYDVICHYADAVLSGGIRRSATIALFDLHDAEMMAAKTGNWFVENPQRGRSNNSVVLVRGVTDEAEFKRVFASTRQFGEPGFLWVSHPDMIVNPCVEIGLYGRLHTDTIPDDYDGPVVNGALSGFQMCNVTSINCKTVVDAEDFYGRCRIASILGTWQAGLTTFPYLGSVSEQIVQREALLGVSLCGVMHQPDLFLDPAVLRNGVATVDVVNLMESAAIGVKPAARLTCIKPDGNLSALFGNFSGCHPGKMRRGFRHVQVNRAEAAYQHFQSVNPEACAESVWSANGTDDVIRFPVEYEGIVEGDVSAVEFLSHVRTLQEHWVLPGTKHARCVQPWLTHNVSNTVRVEDGEWDDVAASLFAHQKLHAGVSFISAFGDRDYEQAPYTAVYTATEREAMYGKLATSAVTTRLVQQARKHFRSLWDACDYALGKWPEQKEPTISQRCWVENFNAYAGEFRSREQATYCLKDAWNAAEYERITEVFRPVDYSRMREVVSGVQMVGEVACVGGQCE